MTKEQLKELAAQLDLATKQLDQAAIKLIESGCDILIKVSHKTENFIYPSDKVESTVTKTTIEVL